MRVILYEICRWTAAAAAIFFIISSVGGGSYVSAANPQTVLEAAYASADTTRMQPASNQMIRRLYGLDPSEYEFCFLYYSLTNMDVEEMFLIKYADSSQEKKVMEAFEVRMDSQKKAFESYGVGQMEMLCNHSVCVSESGFAFLVVNSRAAESYEAFAEAIRGKE